MFQELVKTTSEALAKAQAEDDATFLEVVNKIKTHGTPEEIEALEVLIACFAVAEDRVYTEWN